MSTINYAPKQKQDRVTNFAFYLLSGGLVVSLIIAIVYVILSYLG